MSSSNSSRKKQRQCEVLGELFRGPTGVACVGRMLRGSELGRLVFLREVRDISLENIKSYIDTARCVAHPALLKVVGRVETPETIYVASEYISGVSLLELVENAIARKQRIETAIAVRIIRDILLAAAHAKRLLSEATGASVHRSIFPDTVWIAEFGESMLTEVGLAGVLNVEHSTHSGLSQTSQEEEIGNDVSAAGAELLKLLTNQPLEEAEMTLPLAGDLASIVARAVNPAAPNRFKSPEEMASALSALPADFIADEVAVGNAVRTLMASVLAVRHPRRLMSVAAPVAGGGDATCVFRDSVEYASASEVSPVQIEHQQQRSERSSHPVAPSHPAYAFLAKHGLLDHAGGILEASDDGDDKTLVMRPRQSRSDPASAIKRAAATVFGASRANSYHPNSHHPEPLVPPVRPPHLGTDHATRDAAELAEKLKKDRVRLQVMAMSAVVLLLVLALGLLI